MGTKVNRRARGRAVSEDELAVQDLEARADDGDFAVTGTSATGEYRCSDCGYGAVVQRALPPCPMCGGSAWESRPPRFAD